LSSNSLWLSGPGEAAYRGRAADPARRRGIYSLQKLIRAFQQKCKGTPAVFSFAVFKKLQKTSNGGWLGWQETAVLTFVADGAALLAAHIETEGDEQGGVLAVRPPELEPGPQPEPEPEAE
jgi:hypothetical protein